MEKKKSSEERTVKKAAPKKRKKTIKKGLIGLIIVLALIVMLAGGSLAYLNSVNNAALPQLDGQLNEQGLWAKVEIIRDSHSVPHIYADNMHDLYFAQGYVQAQDRWWQMEFFRHTCAGRIEELTGKKAQLISSDIYLRSMGWYKVAEQEYNNYTQEQRFALDSFAEGVNAYISDRTPEQLSVNYSILGLTGVKFNIEPWNAVDTLAFGKLMSWDLGYSNDEELVRSKLYSLLGEQMADAWQTPTYGYDSKPTVMQEEDLKVMKAAGWTSPLSNTGNSTAEPTGSGQSFLDSKPDLSWLMGDPAGKGSNNWVVAGSMTETGMPLLADDPHLSIQMPSIWYEISLHSADDGSGQPFDVAGFSFSSAPGVIIGHNSHIAWGVTNVYPDVHDHYQIKVNPDNPLQYQWNGEWKDMTVRQEIIRFGDGSSPIAIKVRETHLGPIINDNKIDAVTGQFLGSNNKDPLALRWTALEPGTLALAIQGLNKARNWEQFRSALQYWESPSQNIIYADRYGNIGYQMPGKVPIRAKGDNGLLPMPGWTDEHEWKGYIPYDLLPRTYNPSRGYIITANQAVVPPEYNDFLKIALGADLSYNLGYEWNLGYRAQRLNQLMEELAPHSIETFQQMQGDNKLLSVGEVLPYLANIKFSNKELTRAVDWLVNWDYTFDADCPQAALYSEFWMRLVKNTFQNKLGDTAQAKGGSRDMWVIKLLLEKPDDPWWDDPTTKGKIETRDDILEQSFIEGFAATGKTLGYDREKWQWGQLHTATFVSNPLGSSGIGPVESLINRGPYPVGGTAETPNSTKWLADKDNFSVDSLPSMRMIIDMGDLSRSICMNSTGQSGNPASKWYSSMIKPWLEVKYHPMLWTREQVEADAKHRLLIEP
ncbi:MAG: penicillin acylase family protein [Dehalococcoidia bacterium]|nr:penicillin acylase family protein [Dehalococcoidia bacterium]